MRLANGVKIGYWHRSITLSKPGIVFHYHNGNQLPDIQVHIPRAIADMPNLQRVLLGKGIEIKRVNE